jgi:glycosyltransferase 2 family protein
MAEHTAQPMAARADSGHVVRKALIFGAKLAITCGCFWYLFRQINIDDLAREAQNLQARWFLLACLVMMIQPPLTGWRWAKITAALEPARPSPPLGAMLAITLIVNFFNQILPNVMSDALRIWMLTQIRSGWRMGLAGVVIDRAVGIGALLTIGFVTLLNASAFTTLGGYRETVLAIFGALLLGGTGALLCAPFYAPMLSRWRVTKWIGEMGLASRQVLVESPAAISIVGIAFIVHALSILGVWSVGQTFSMSLGLVEAATLFTLMVAIGIIPISVSGWGLREVAVTAFLNAHGVPTQRALLFSICFGLTLIVSALPGALILMFYSPAEAGGDATRPHEAGAATSPNNPKS